MERLNAGLGVVGGGRGKTSIARPPRTPSRVDVEFVWWRFDDENVGDVGDVG